jgi:hypothetical protein
MRSADPIRCVALSCLAIGAYAQDQSTRTETRTSGTQPQTVTYTGCVQTGTQEKTYILDEVVPVKRRALSTVPMIANCIRFTRRVRTQTSISWHEAPQLLEPVCDEDQLGGGLG